MGGSGKKIQIKRLACWLPRSSVIVISLHALRAVYLDGKASRRNSMARCRSGPGLGRIFPSKGQPHTNRRRHKTARWLASFSLQLADQAASRKSRPALLGHGQIQPSLSWSVPVLKILGPVARIAMLTAGEGAHATERAIIVFDGSGSMWGQIDGKPKLEIARQALRDMLATVPDTMELGLMAYGHREKGNCNDIETLVAP